MYAGGNPVNRIDPTGLNPQPSESMSFSWEDIKNAAKGVAAAAGAAWEGAGAVWEGVKAAAKEVYDNPAYVANETFNPMTSMESYDKAANEYNKAQSVSDKAVAVGKGLLHGADFAAKTTVILAPVEGIAKKLITNVGKAITEQTTRELLFELASNGIKHTPENIVRIARDEGGRVVFLEKGTAESGLQHIIKRHAAQFVEGGVAEESIPDLIMKAVTQGKQVGMQGTRPIFEVEFNGVTRRVAVNVGSNGYIVGANPK